MKPYKPIKSGEEKKPTNNEPSDFNLQGETKQPHTNEERKQSDLNADLSGSSKQARLHNLIENSTLRNAIQGQVLNRGSLVYSTERAIKRINRLLRQGASKQKIDAALRVVNISITSRELMNVIAESNSTRMNSPRDAYNYLKRQFKQLKNDKVLVSQLFSRVIQESFVRKLSK